MLLMYGIIVAGGIEDKGGEERGEERGKKGEGDRSREERLSEVGS